MKKSLILMVWLLISCEFAVLEPLPNTDPHSILKEYATLVREKYAMLEYKGIDLDLEEKNISNNITGNETEDELLAKIGRITFRLRDGHSYLLSNNNKAVVFDVKEGYPKVFFPKKLKTTYWQGLEEVPLKNDKNDFKIRYGRLASNNNIGYIFIESFNGSVSDEYMETIFKSVLDTKGLIIDIRGNGGGDPNLAYRFASYLTDKRYYIGYENFKSGKGANDFTASKFFINPSGSSYTYLKPVYLITDRGSFSASLTLLYCTDVLPHVFRLGQKAGGGSGSIADGFLANGWRYQLSVSEFISANEKHLDGGMNADIPLKYKPKRKADTFILRAISEILK